MKQQHDETVDDCFTRSVCLFFKVNIMFCFDFVRKVKAFVIAKYKLFKDCEFYTSIILYQCYYVVYIYISNRIIIFNSYMFYKVLCSIKLYVLLLF